MDCCREKGLRDTVIFLDPPKLLDIFNRVCLFVPVIFGQASNSAPYSLIENLFIPISICIIHTNFGNTKIYIYLCLLRKLWIHAVDHARLGERKGYYIRTWNCQVFTVLSALPQPKRVLKTLKYTYTMPKSPSTSITTRSQKTSLVVFIHNNKRVLATRKTCYSVGCHAVWSIYAFLDTDNCPRRRSETAGNFSQLFQQTTRSHSIPKNYPFVRGGWLKSARMCGTKLLGISHPWLLWQKNAFKTSPKRFLQAIEVCLLAACPAWCWWANRCPQRHGAHIHSPV